MGYPVPPEKHCARCMRYLPAAAFREDPRLHSGLSSWCRECAIAATQEWRARQKALR
jgi:hypothetical protein